MKKSPIKSKTIRSALIIALIAILSLFGVGETEIEKTVDGMGENNPVPMETVKEIATLLAAGGAIYGRYKAKD